MDSSHVELMFSYSATRRSIEAGGKVFPSHSSAKKLSLTLPAILDGDRYGGNDDLAKAEMLEFLSW